VSKFTPGPWKYDTYGMSAYVFTDSKLEEAICDLEYDTDDPDAEDDARELVRANARLISAAPDLLDALREFVRRFESADDEPAYVVRARAAIAKAESR
jgi:hypothetical protein